MSIKKCKSCDEKLTRVEGCQLGSCRNCPLNFCQNCCDENSIEYNELLIKLEENEQITD